MCIQEKMDLDYSEEPKHDFFPFFKVLKNGRIERYSKVPKVPPSMDPNSAVGSKDVVISTRPNIRARIFMPRIPDPPTKFPLVVYYHGGGFSVGSAFGQDYHNYLTSMVGQANVVAVSFEYRLAPEEPVTACHEDSWAGLQWVGLHAGRAGPDPWLNGYADFGRVFVAGDSSGANLAYHVAVRAGSGRLPGLNITGLALVHPYFVGYDRYDRIMEYMIGGALEDGLQDRRLRPTAEDMGMIGCGRVLVFVAGKDGLRDVDVRFCDDLKEIRRRIGSGTVEMVEHDGGHVFHLKKPLSKNAIDLMKKLVAFINQEPIKLLSKM